MLLKSIKDEPKVDLRIRRTRQMLQQALNDLMREKSFQDITVRDIAERAMVNRVTFYKHFTDKYTLLEYNMRQMIKQQLRGRVPEGSHFSSENVAQLLMTVCEFLSQMGNHCPPPHNQFEPLMEKQIKAELYDVFKAWLIEPPTKKSGRAAPELAAMIASWAIYGAAVQWSQQEQPEPVAQFAEQALPIILAGLNASLPG